LSHYISIDLETYSSVPINKVGLYKYVQSPDFEILLFGYSTNGNPPKVIDLTQGEKFPEWLITLLLDSKYHKKAYNAAFEWYCLSKYLCLSNPCAWLPQWRDTMLHSLYCGYPASLDAAGKALRLPEDKRKLTTGKALIKLFCTPHTPTDRDPRTRIRPQDEPEKWKLFKTYNAGDVTAEQEIERRLSPFPVPQEVQHQWETDLRINSRGAALDLDLIHGALECDDTVSRPLIDEARQITGLQNPNSLAQVKGWLQGQGYDVSTLRKDDVTTLLDKDDLDDKTRRVLEIRQKLGKTSVKKYTAMQAAACADGRVRGSLMFYGANRTGRWAGRIIQPQNLPRTYIHGGMLDFARELVKARKVENLKLIYGSVPDTLSQLIRTALVPTPGNLFIDADFSAIEARVVAWLAGQTDTLEIFRSGKDIYCATASRMFGVPVEKNGINGDLRQKGKIATLALGYGGGTNALQRMDTAHSLKEEELPDIVRRWRESNKRIRDLWYKVENASLECIKTGKPQGVRGLLFAMEGDQSTNQWFMTITLPSGRKLYYAKPYITPGQYGDALHYWGMNQTSHKWQVTDTWGGKLVENITQATARDCLAENIERLEAAGYPIVFHVHDEIIADCTPEKADLKNVIEIMSQPISWASGLPLSADGWVGSFYTKE
jgi:DNA polymerase